MVAGLTGRNGQLVPEAAAEGSEPASDIAPTRGESPPTSAENIEPHALKSQAILI